MPSNEGVVITGSRNLNNLVSVKEIPYPTLEDDMIIIKAVAYAVNPTDWKHILPESFASHLVSELFKKFGLGLRPLEKVWGSIGSNIGYFVGKGFTLMQKGSVSGSDVSGYVEEVGSKVLNLKKGDIVSASLHGGISSDGGFSKYVKVSPNSVIKFEPSQILKEPLSTGQHPGSVISSFEAAASIPVGLKTVALSFYHNLKIPADKSKNKDQYVLIWGGATATGILAIQIAKSIFGIKVLTTASKRNHSTLLKLGADQVFDYNDADVIKQLQQAGEGKIRYGLDCVSSPETLQLVYDATEGTENVVIDNLLFLNEKSINAKTERKVKITATDGYLTDGRKHFGHVASEQMLNTYLEFWNKYTPLIAREIKSAPLQVLPVGLESANEGLGLLIQNKINGRKVVFRNDGEF